MRKRADISSLDRHLGYWLRYVANHVSHGFRLKLDAQDVTVAEWVILRQLYEEDEVMPSQVAARLGMTRGAISKLIDRLVAKSLVTRKPSQEDLRVQTLSLTPKGLALTPVLAALADRNDEEFFGHLKAADRAKVEAVMKDVVRRLGLKAVPVD